MKNYLIIIVGPTAIGKTALSLKLAQHYSCEILSCDSRQFFKEIKIGTAVPNEEELAAANHHFIQNKSIFENYTVGDFEKEAIAKLDELFHKNNIQIVVGGSGLYVNAILQGFDDFPEIPTEIRENVRNQYEENGLEFLQQKLQKLDSNYYSTLLKENPQTLQNPQRMMRFVEVCLASNLPYSLFLNQKKNKRNFTPIVIGLEAERDIMYNRINQRDSKGSHCKANLASTSSHSQLQPCHDCFHSLPKPNAACQMQHAKACHSLADQGSPLGLRLGSHIHLLQAPYHQWFG